MRVSATESQSLSAHQTAKPSALADDTDPHHRPDGRGYGGASHMCNRLLPATPGTNPYLLVTATQTQSSLEGYSNFRLCCYTSTSSLCLAKTVRQIDGEK